MQITLDVIDGEGKVTKWMAQGTSPNMLVLRPPEWRILELVCEDDASFLQLETLTAQPAR
jgi:hypothetical protein